MEASLINDLIKLRATEKQANYTWRYDTINLDAGQTQAISAHKNLLILVGEPRFIQISSDRGFYNYGELDEHEHTGNVSLTNMETQASKVSFVRVIWQ